MKSILIPIVFFLLIGSAAAQEIAPANAYDVWVYSLFSVIIVSAVSLIGVVALFVRIEKLQKTLLYFVSFSAGALMGDAFIHLLPEIVERYGFVIEVSMFTLSGIVISFIIEKAIHWKHSHAHTPSGTQPFALMNLFGDAVHNFIDGIIIGASYLISIPVGIATTIAVIVHEIPQELGDFGVLIHGGFTKKRAVKVNFLTAFTAIIGVIFSLILSSLIEGVTLFLIPFAAGSFIYIAGSDLIPELNKEIKGGKKSALQLILFILGILVMFALV